MKYGVHVKLTLHGLYNVEADSPTGAAERVCAAGDWRDGLHCDVLWDQEVVAVLTEDGDDVTPERRPVWPDPAAERKYSEEVAQ